MADVQLEHGHVRVANRLYEAFLDADFTATQFKIVHALVRLTFGWRKKTVTCSQAELAAAANMTATGSFRAALRELVVEGVVLHLEQGGGHSKSTFAVQKDFTRWGRWAIHPDRLARRYGTRPEANDALLDEPDDHTPDTVPTGDGACTKAPGVPADGQSGCLHVGTPTPPKSNTGNDVDDRKDSDRQGKPVESERADAREAKSASTAVGSVARDALAGLMADVGMAGVDAFIATRRLETHANWLKEFAILVGPGSQFTPADLDGACADALMQERPVEGPHAIRAFCAKRAAERVGARSGTKLLAIAGSVRSRDAQLAEAGELVSRIRLLKQSSYTPGGGTKHFIALQDVRALGDDVLRAYEFVGGAGKFLTLDEKADGVSFLIRDFAGALDRARAKPVGGSQPVAAAVG